jgi:hypothetical protein
VIEAVIWDFGGVFTTSPFEAFNRYEAARGLPHDFIRTVNATHPDHNAWALFERAEITTAEFDARRPSRWATTYRAPTCCRCCPATCATRSSRR